MSREQRRNVAADTLHVLEQGFYLNKAGKKVDLSEAQKYAEENTKVYPPEETDELIQKVLPKTKDKTTSFQVISDTTLNAVRQMLATGYDNIFCLNFASAKNPGGGFRGGSQAQEESIARSTGLYPCLLQGDEYYSTNKSTKSCFYTDYMIYSPKVPIIKDENGEYLDEVKTVSILTSPAVNTHVVKQREPAKLSEIEVVMKRRIEKVLMISYENNHQNLVLGAWGCGVFGNDPEEVARYFNEVIANKFNNVFENIFFAVYSKNEKFIRPFYRYFG